jgi:DNA-binding NtrC family response regulator
MNRLTRHYGVPAPSFSDALLEAAQRHSWPGNLRQLEIFVKRFLAFGDESAALEELNFNPRFDAVDERRNGGTNGNGSNGDAGIAEKSSLRSLVRHAKGEAERNAISHALEETHWNRKAAARALSMSYRALLYKIQEYQLIPQESLPIRGQRNSLGNGSR